MVYDHLVQTNSPQSARARYEASDNSSWYTTRYELVLYPVDSLAIFKVVIVSGVCLTSRLHLSKDRQAVRECYIPLASHTATFLREYLAGLADMPML